MSSKEGMLSPRQFADGVHAVMMADRTVYATHVVTNLKKQEAPVSADEYWQDSDNAIPAARANVRMGARARRRKCRSWFHLCTSQ